MSPDFREPNHAATLFPLMRQGGRPSMVILTSAAVGLPVALVEAAGVEPASESSEAWLLHA